MVLVAHLAFLARPVRLTEPGDGTGLVPLAGLPSSVTQKGVTLIVSDAFFGEGGPSARSGIESARTDDRTNCRKWKLLQNAERRMSTRGATAGEV